MARPGEGHAAQLEARSQLELGRRVAVGGVVGEGGHARVDDGDGAALVVGQRAAADEEEQRDLAVPRDDEHRAGLQLRQARAHLARV